MEKINITIEDSIAVEKAFYEYNASLDILSYLMKQKEINEDYLNQYFKKTEEYKVYLDELKELVINKYFNEIPSKYLFNFKTFQVEYEK